MDSTDTSETKIKALCRDATQIGEPSEERKARSRARHEEIGKRIGVPLAEQFKCLDIWR